MTIKEIAREAGVAMSTVSLVLNDKPGVRKETRERITGYLLANGYRIRTHEAEDNQGGEIRFLRLIASNHINERNHEFFTDLLNGAERCARQKGYDFSFSNVTTDEIEQVMQELDGRENLAGVLMLASELKDENLPALLRYEGPLVLLDCPVEQGPINCINTDNVSGAYAAVGELYRQGHREIGFLRGEVEIGGMHSRYEGYCKAMRSLGLPIRDEHVICVDTIVDVATEQILARCKQPEQMPTAFFACNDLIGAGAVRAFQQLGYRVPEDISIIGFDDVQICSFVTPPLSTMRIDRFRMGELGVERLIALRCGKKDDKLRCLMAVTPILRGSIAPPQN